MTPRERRIERRRVATEYVNSVNAKTSCKRCGVRGVQFDWHHDDHPLNPNSRVSSLRTQGASVERIKQEIARCVPYCRRCHMTMDNRIADLIASHVYKKGETYVPPKPCSDCGKLAKPTRRGRCNHCYIKFMGIR